MSSRHFPGRNPGRRGRRPDDLPPELARVVNRGVVPPAVVGKQQAPSQSLGLTGIAFDRSGFVYDDQAIGPYVVSDKVDGAWTFWGGTGANALNIQLGPTTEPLLVHAWATFAWANNGVSNGGQSGPGQACIALGESGLGASTRMHYALNRVHRNIANDSNYVEMSLFARIELPVIQSADWRLTVMHRYDRGGANVGQRVRYRSLMCFCAAFPPGLDTTLTTDATV